MIPVARVREPRGFDERCRRPGRAWRAQNPTARRPKDLWSPFRPALADGFSGRCGYAAMYDPVGSVDHYRSVRRAPELAYEWSNLRFVAEWINKSKQNVDDAVLDPYEVQDGWFELSLPDLQLRVTERVPAKQRARAEHTLTRLHLRDDERVLRQRRAWYAMYQGGKLTLEGLDQVAPLIAAAIRRASPPRRTKPAPRRRRPRSNARR